MLTGLAAGGVPLARPRRAATAAAPFLQRAPHAMAHEARTGGKMAQRCKQTHIHKNTPELQAAAAAQHACIQPPTTQGRLHACDAAHPMCWKRRQQPETTQAENATGTHREQTQQTAGPEHRAEANTRGRRVRFVSTTARPATPNKQPHAQSQGTDTQQQERPPHTHRLPDRTHGWEPAARLSRRLLACSKRIL